MNSNTDFSILEVDLSKYDFHMNRAKNRTERRKEAAVKKTKTKKSKKSKGY